jgi:DNA polymerase-3 subunit epsilon
MGFLRRALGSSTQPADADEWVVVDLETTGLHPRVDRIVEIGLVRVSSDGRELDAWTTVVDPQRDTGPVRIHGLSARDVVGAPRFRDIAGDLLGHLGGAHLAAHNARFEQSFIGAEFERLGFNWGPPEIFCTMSVPSRLGVVHSRALTDCCSELGIQLVDHHTALSDARAAAGLLFATIACGRPLPPLPPRTPGWPLPEPPGRLHPRGTPRPVADSRLPALAARVGVPDEVAVDHEVAAAYLSLLDRVLEDRRVTGDEVAALASFATEWGIDQTAVAQLHALYLDAVVRLAWADGVVTPAEQSDLETVAELLGVSLASRAPSPVAATDVEASIADWPDRSALPREVARNSELSGMSVCFTGESVCAMHRRPLSREQQEFLAASAGLRVKSSVSGRLDILVLADVASQSGKARKAAELGVRRIAEPVFWRLIGVPVD